MSLRPVSAVTLYFVDQSFVKRLAKFNRQLLIMAQQTLVDKCSYLVKEFLDFLIKLA